MYQTYIFDLDGTLLDTLEDLAEAVNVTLEYFNRPKRSIEEVKEFVGNGIVKLLDRSFGEKVESSVVEYFKKYYGAHCEDKTKPYDGVLDLLQELKVKGCQLAIVSNKADFAVKQLSKKYFGEYIDVAIGENEEGGVKKKPAPDSVFLAMKELNAFPESTVYIGDSDVDIQTAKNAGLDCICVAWGFRDEEFLKANGAERIIYTCKELL